MQSPSPASPPTATTPSSDEPGASAAPPGASPSPAGSALSALTGSKKFLVTAAAILIVAASYLARLAGVEVDQDALFKLVICPMIAFVGAQGMADFGKERKG